VPPEIYPVFAVFMLELEKSASRSSDGQAAPFLARHAALEGRTRQEHTQRIIPASMTATDPPWFALE
jgi:hypothetical protein